MPSLTLFLKFMNSCKCHMECTYLNSWTRWAVILEPEAPSGWPSAIAPPFTFSLLMSRSSSLAQAKVCAPNASLIWNYKNDIFKTLQFQILYTFRNSNNRPSIEPWEPTLCIFIYLKDRCLTNPSSRIGLTTSLLAQVIA